MPTADPFTALGAGNGFTGCPIKVDVSEAQYSDWSTLGGTNKDNIDTLSTAEIEQNIATSRANAMKLFWMDYNISGTTYTRTSSGNASLSVPNLRSATDTTLLGEPRERVCLNTGAYNLHYGMSYSTATQIEYRLPSRLYGMYNGSTAVPENFIGYGYDELDLTSTATYLSGVGVYGFANSIQAMVSMISVVKGAVADGGWADSYNNFGDLVARSYFETDYVEVNNIPFVGLVIAKPSGVDVLTRGSTNISLASLQANVYYDWPQENRGNSVVELNLSANPIEFYTYP